MAFVARFLFGGTGVGFHPQCMEKVNSYLVKGDHVAFFVQFRIDDVAALPHDGGHEAEFAGFDGRDKEAPDAQRTGPRLMFVQAVEEAHRQASV